MRGSFVCAEDLSTLATAITGLESVKKPVLDSARIPIDVGSVPFETMCTAVPDDNIGHDVILGDQL